MKFTLKDLWRLFLITVGAALMAFNISSFVNVAGLLPGGFTGLSLLIQESFKKFLDINIPFSPFYWTLNIIPAFICFRSVGKKLTLFSIIMILLTGFFTDLLPAMHFTDDLILCSVFGGLLNGASISICLFAGATSGGTDFISIFVSEKTGKSAWNYIFAANCLILAIFGILFGWTRALYSIIFQFSSTQILNLLYKRYQKTTLLIVTDKVSDVYKAIHDTTNHDATVFTGKGCYQDKEHPMLYTVVGSDEESPVIRAVKKADPCAFINVLQTKMLKGNFFMRKNE